MSALEEALRAVPPELAALEQTLRAVPLRRPSCRLLRRPSGRCLRVGCLGFPLVEDGSPSLPRASRHVRGEEEPSSTSHHVSRVEPSSASRHMRRLKPARCR